MKAIAEAHAGITRYGAGDWGLDAGSSQADVSEYPDAGFKTAIPPVSGVGLIGMVVRRKYARVSPLRLMQESNDRSSAPKRARKPGRRRGVVLLISSNPLALPELRRLARTRQFRQRLHYLKLGLVTEVEDIRLPRASVLVLDTFSTGAMTEKVVAAIRTQHPRACVIALVGDLGDAQGFALLQLGVKGILTHRDWAASLGKAIAFVAAGGVRMPRGLMGRFLDSYNVSALSHPSVRRLSGRERQVLDGVVKSQSNKEIANELHLSESTVKFHLARIFRKFGVRRRSELISQAAQDAGGRVH